MGNSARKMTSPINNSRTTRGVTLLELLLVLSLLVIIGAMAFPAIHGAFDRQILRKSAEQIRVDLAKTRNEAMRSGKIMVFQYQAEAGSYQIQPWAQQTDLVEGDLQTLSTMGSAGSNNGSRPGANSATPLSAQPGNPLTPSTLGYLRARDLPDGVVFVGANVGQDLRLQSVDPTIATMVNQNPPLVFYPDGTSSNAQIVLRNRQGHVAIVQLRALTGMSRLVDPLPDGSLPSLDPQPGVPSP